MVELGYTLSSEEHGPADLVTHATRAEEVGFDFLSISDHFHPWISQQGNSPFVWSTLGGVAAATDEIDVGVGVTCPIIDAGYDHVYVHQVGPNQEKLLAFYEDEILPKFE